MRQTYGCIKSSAVVRGVDPSAVRRCSVGARMFDYRPSRDGTHTESEHFRPTASDQWKDSCADQHGREIRRDGLHRTVTERNLDGRAADF